MGLVYFTVTLRTLVVAPLQPSPIYYDNFKHKLDDLKSRSCCFAEANGCLYHQYHIPSLEELDMNPYLIEFANNFCLWIVNSIQSKGINGR